MSHPCPGGDIPCVTISVADWRIVSVVENATVVPDPLGSTVMMYDVGHVENSSCVIGPSGISKDPVMYHSSGVKVILPTVCE